MAPAFGFQKNFPFEDNDLLRARIAAAYRVCEVFGTSIGFHSGSGKSAENYRICGEMTKGHLEIKTSGVNLWEALSLTESAGRYTYEFGKALSQSSDPQDQQ